MALSAAAQNICKKLELSLTGFVEVVASSYSAVSSTLNLIKTTIAGMQFATTDQLNAAAAAVDSGLDNAIPNFTDEMSDVMRMIRMLKRPVS